MLWLRRPKYWPISERPARVCLRASHIASIRGVLTFFVRRSVCKLSLGRPNTSQTARWISASRTPRVA